MSINIRALGYQFKVQSCTFGSGISDHFDKNQSLEDLNQINAIMENYYTHDGIDQDEYLDIVKELQDNEISSSQQNVNEFMKGCLDYSRSDLLEQYLDRYSDK